MNTHRCIRVFIVSLASFALIAPAAHAQPKEDDSRSSAETTSASDVTVLQMNLCNSGLASCYADGEAIGEAQDKIAEVKPDVVTLNEVCSRDVEKLADAANKQHVFKAAGSESNGTTKCANGDSYGIGVLGGSGEGPPSGYRYGQYAAQDDEDENRVYLCGSFDDVTACTTHLSLESDVAFAQCTSDQWPLNGRADENIVLGGDLNMRGAFPDINPCNGGGFRMLGYYEWKWWGRVVGLQRIIASAENFSVEGQNTHSMSHTDHPAFEVRLNTR